MRTNAIEPRLRVELNRLAESHDCELIHVEFRSGVLQLVLDRPAGIRHEHCAAVSREASAILDAENFGSGRYTLEVSSPGLDRQLYRSEDYERFVGRELKVTFHTAEQKKRTVYGRLYAFDPEDGGTAVIQEQTSGEELRLPLVHIKVARLQVEL